MKYALAGWPPVAEGVIAEKYVSAAPKSTPSFMLQGCPNDLTRVRIAMASKNMKPSIEARAKTIHNGSAPRRSSSTAESENPLTAEDTAKTDSAAITTNSTAQISFLFLSLPDPKESFIVHLSGYKRSRQSHNDTCRYVYKVMLLGEHHRSRAHHEHEAVQPPVPVSGLFHLE